MRQISVLLGMIALDEGLVTPYWSFWTQWRISRSTTESEEKPILRFAQDDRWDALCWMMAVS